MGDKVLPASQEAELAIKKFRLAPGIRAQLWAAEPLVANIVAFQFDDQGGCYVVETFRHSQGVTDIRGHMNWLDEELASRSVEDRAAILNTHEKSRIADYSRYGDRVRFVWDSAGSGRADKASVFSEGYTGITEGLAAGVLPWRGSVYFANIPHLWRLQDKNQDHIAEQKESLLYGFGVRTGFMGHDLHGLTIGPDGKLYFSIGDRGAHIVTGDGRTVSNPETGAFYRCQPDGSGLEIISRGLRNPQGIAFDDYGDWFTGDNNSDGGDLARWVALVEGADSGWHIGYQFIEKPNSRGPWIAEKMFYPETAGQPAYILPPIANIASGPSGLAYYPGTGLPDRYKNHFFLTDFTGGRGSSVHTFAVKPKGAGYELVDRGSFISELLVTDVRFGPDGAAYVSDWVEGWDKTGKGRIYRLSDTNSAADAVRRDVQTLLKSDWTRHAIPELSSLLAHADQRIRLRAQFAMVDLGAPGERALKEAFRKSKSQLARIHALWGLGQRFEKKTQDSQRREIASLFVSGLKDSDAEIRAQSARRLGEARWKPAAEILASRMTDESPRVRAVAGLALSKLGASGVESAFIQLAASDEAAHDPYIRHTAVMGLSAVGGESMLAGLATHESAEVRRTAVIALRRLESPKIALFLKDKSTDIVTEAARAISDVPIPAALPELASISNAPASDAALWRRVINAHLRLGTAVDAEAAVRVGRQVGIPIPVRLEALQCLMEWEKPSGRDRVTGLWRPLPARSGKLASSAAIPALEALLADKSAPIQEAAIRLVETWKVASASETLFSLLKATSTDKAVRRAALSALSAIKSSRASEAIDLASEDADEALRRESTRLRGASGDRDALEKTVATLKRGSRGEQQAALSVLGDAREARADEILLDWVGRLSEGKLAPALQLDLLEAASKRPSPALKKRVEAFEAARNKEDSIGAYRECLEGGDAAAGRKIFFERADVACMRCHKVRGEGGEVGPDLTDIATRKPRNYVLESIVAPNREIAAGFETVLVKLKDGNTYAGQIKKESDVELEINSPEDGILKIKKSEIVERQRGLSGMPEELRQMLSKRDLRNLVEFLYQH
ncbi:MAG: HEAT repeat domain-containing protein [Verrucomicrobia bacterium]|nr:HEAT repeat domain-containing protein [Verrucomicrobiota bacterium]